MDALIALVRKDIVLYFSNRRALLVTLAAPILIAAFFGSVMGGAPKKPTAIPIAVAQAQASPKLAAIAQRLRADDTFTVSEVPEDEAIRLVRAGKVRAAVIFTGDEVAIHHDPSQSMVLPMVRGILTQHAFGVLNNTP